MTHKVTTRAVAREAHTVARSLTARSMIRFWQGSVLHQMPETKLDSVVFLPSDTEARPGVQTQTVDAAVMALNSVSGTGVDCLARSRRATKKATTAKAARREPPTEPSETASTLTPFD